MIIPIRSFFCKDLILFSIHTQLLGLILYFEEAEGNKKSNTRSGLWFPCLPRIAYWDARVEMSESFICMKATNLPSTFIQGYGIHACPGLPFGDARVETSESFICMKATNLPSTFIQGYGFHACPGLPIGMHERDARASGGLFLSCYRISNDNFSLFS